MIVRVETLLEIPALNLFETECDPRTLVAFAAPLLDIEPLAPAEFPARWTEGADVTVRTRLFGVIPQAPHRIRFVIVDSAGGVIETDESGGAIRRWRHRLTIQPAGGKLSRYVDRIEIEAGWRTPFLWLSAQLFYRRRQARWRKILRLAND